MGRMSGSSAPLAAALLLLACYTSQVHAQDSFLIRWKQDIVPTQIRADAPDHLSLFEADIIDKLKALGMKFFGNIGSSGFWNAKFGQFLSLPIVQEVLDQLGLEVLEDYKLKHQAIPNDQFWTYVSTAMSQIQAPDAWNTFTGSGPSYPSTTKVCVIDSGIRFDHPDLAANMPDALVYDAINDVMAQPTNDDTGGHGTHVTGTIGAVGNNNVGVPGVNWNVHIIGCKFIDGENGGAVSDAIKCIRWCRDQGARITSNSWGSASASNAALVQEVQLAQDAGMLFVCAAGNDGVDIDQQPSSPSDIDLPSVISVGAVDENDLRADFSNYGSQTVDIFAPGTQIASTWPVDTTTGQPYGYNIIQGTSMATPHVSGAAALLWSLKPSASAADIKAALMQSVDIVPGAAQSVSGGRLNLNRAVQIITGNGGTTPNPTPGPTPTPTPPPSGCQDYSPQCQSWYYANYCAPGYTYGGYEVRDICPLSCGNCGGCADLYPGCPQYAAAGYCSPEYVINGESVANVGCKESCGTCSSLGTLSVPVPELDIGGVWTTGSFSTIFLSYDPQAGRGYAVWLKNPPQSLTVKHVGKTNYTMTDVAGNTYVIHAFADAGQTDANKLVIGSGSTAQTWTKASNQVTNMLRKYMVVVGDTLDSIAAKLGVTTQDLINANPFLKFNTALLPGATIVKPGTGNHGPASLFTFSDNPGANASAASVITAPADISITTPASPQPTQSPTPDAGSRSVLSLAVLGAVMLFGMVALL